MTWIAIAAGGAIGAMARHAMNAAIPATSSTRFPLSTLIVNVSGCLAIGVLAGLLAADRIALRVHWREFVFVGLLGGFTTFSSFGLETLLLARTHSPSQAAMNVVAQVAGGLIAVWVGYQLGMPAVITAKGSVAPRRLPPSSRAALQGCLHRRGEPQITDLRVLVGGHTDLRFPIVLQPRAQDRQQLSADFPDAHTR